MRPPGEIRMVLRAAAVEMGSGGQAFAWRELAERTQVGYSAARYTVMNMCRAGELVRSGYAKSAHSTNWVALYEVVSPPPPECARPIEGPGISRIGALDDLGVVVLSWAREGGP